MNAACSCRARTIEKSAEAKQDHFSGNSGTEDFVKRGGEDVGQRALSDSWIVVVAFVVNDSW